VERGGEGQEAPLLLAHVLPGFPTSTTTTTSTTNTTTASTTADGSAQMLSLLQL